MRYSSIDYLQFSTYDKLFLNEYGELREDWKIEVTNDKPVRHYRHGTRFMNGVAVYWGNVNSNKYLYIYSGRACESMGITPQYVARLIERGATFSRIDFAVTTNVNFLVKLVKDSDKIESNLYKETHAIIDKDVNPETVYIGDMKKRGKKGIVRAYDKALELGLTDTELYRFELESRGKRAKIDAQRYARSNSIESIIKSRIDIDTDWFTWLMSNEQNKANSRVYEDNSIPEIERKMAWLERQVIPSLQWVKKYDRDNGTQNFKRLIDKLMPF